MNTLTTVLGLLPMSLGLGQGGGLQTPLAITIVGGLLSATALTLVVVPVIYMLIDGAEGTRRGRLSGSAENVKEGELLTGGAA
jgi:Cu/Ag efflux pump CusA